MLPLIRQLTPTSPVIRELAQPAAGCRTRFIAFHSDIDHLVVPSRNARLDHPDLNVRNIAVHGAQQWTHRLQHRSRAATA
jgi:triacylglycerol lipase